MPRTPRTPAWWLPQSLVGRVYALYTVTLVIFVGLGLGLFYRYQFELALEDAQQSALMLTEVTAQTITESAVIGDYDTIQRTLEKVVSQSPFSSAAYIDRDGATLRALNPSERTGPAPAWMKARIIDHLTDVNQIISAGGRDYGVLRLVFDADAVTATLWRIVLTVLALALSALAGGLALIWFPLRKWLGTLDRALQVGQSTAPEQAPEVEPLIENLPLEFRPMVQALNRTAASLRGELQTRERALISLREVLADLHAASGDQGADEEATGDAEGDVAQLSAAVGRLVLEREASRAALERARDAAEAANRTKSEFLANMSHEIRTPMNGILGMAQVLESGTLSDAERRESLRILLNSSRALLTLINDILDLSKVESGRIELHPDRFSPGALVRDTTRLFEELARSKGLTLLAESRLPPDCLCLSDQVRVRQMLSNLINNAVKFTEHGEIRVEVAEVGTEADASLLEFSVTDRGPGIPLEKQAMVFERFSQIDGSDTRQHGGTGLGLAIVLNLARLLGGDAGVTSTPGEGSRFWFRIHAPLSSEGPAAASSPGTPDGAVATEGRPEPRTGRVLLAEDNVTNRQVFGLLLGREGLTVHAVEDGQQAIEAVVSQPAFDLILMDIQMPVLDGLQATEQIRRWEAAQRRPRCPVVAVTANVYEENRQRCTAAGIDDFLAKPVILDEMRRMLDRWLPAPPGTPAGATTAARPADLARVRTLARDLLPLLEKNLFTAVARYGQLRDAVEGTGLDARFAEVGRAVGALDFRGAAARLRPLLEALDHEQTAGPPGSD